MEKDKSSKPNDALNVLIDLIPDPVVVIDRLGKIVAANNMIKYVAGYDKEQLIGKSSSFISEEYKRLLAEKAKDRLADSSIESYEIKVTSKSGEIRCLKVNANRFMNEGETLELAIFHDITEQRKIQKELRKGLHESEEKFQGITNSIKEAIIIVNDEAKVTYWNPAAEKIFGYTNKEAVGKNIHDLVVPNSMSLEGKEHISISVKTFAQTGMGYFTVGNVELVGRRKDGLEFPAELSISPTKLVGKWNAVAVVKDISKRKKADQSLRDAEQRYHTLFNQAPLGVLVVDPETAGFVEFNDIAHLQLGYTREEYEKVTIFDIEAKETPDEVRNHMKQMVNVGCSEFETLQRTKNGDIKNILVTTRKFQSAGKTYLHCIFRDNTEIKKVQNAVAESEARYRQLVELAQEGIWAIDNDFTTVFVNPRMAQMLGYTESEMLGKKLLDFVEETAVEIVKNTIIQFNYQKIKGQIEYAFPRRDGTRIITNITMSTIKDDRGKIIGTLAVMVDITERKKAETAVKDSEEKFRNLAEQSPNIILINQKGKVVYANTEAELATGYKKAELYSPDFNFMDLIAPESKDFIRLQFVKHMKGEEVPPYEYKLISKQGQTMDVINSTKIIDYNGEPAILGVETDITENKRLKEKLEQYSMRLEGLVKKRTVQLEQAQNQLVKSERLAAIGELAGMIGHDLRNPLTGIKNSAYFLKKKGSEISPEQAQVMLETIDKCVDYSNKIINDLLDYSKEVRLELRKESIKKLLTESLYLLDLPEKIEVENRLNDNAKVKMDVDKMKRVFINLIKNAFDAMPDGGKITIDSRQINGNLEISFSDTGEGITDDVLPKLFSPLFTTKAQGMGFGLAICKRIIEAHGGSITVETAMGKGTTFTVTLPIEPKFEVGGENTWINIPEFL